MRGFLLDTCVLSEMTKPSPSANVLNWLATQNEMELYICTVTLAELQHGIEKLDAGKLQTYLKAWLQNSVIGRFAARTMTLDTEVALRWGFLLAQTAKLGKSMPVIDSLIAATALTHGLTLVTRKTKEMAACGMPIFNPWTE